MTKFCNAECKYCFTNAEHYNNAIANKELNIDEIVNFLNELTKKGIYKVSVGGGEPFLKNLEEIIKRTSSKMKFSITTNGSIVRDQFIKLFLNNKNIKITISLDSLENEKSNLIRKNIDVNKLIENIKKLCEHEELRERLSIRTTISTINYKEAYDIIRFCEDNKIKNLKINQIENIKFYSGDVEKILPELINTEKIKPDVVFVDPPRKGLDNKTIEILNKTKPEQVIYISCNPATMVRDLQKLENDYIIKEIQPVDMFPYTSHVECVSVLELKESTEK
ncbi:MAG TPA: radical SAM protein [Clostridiaceae bacterium]|nr:radical SAM protein [Clostridiaceae bacterium]